MSRYTVTYLYFLLAKSLQQKEKNDLDRSNVRCSKKWQNFPQCIVYFANLIGLIALMYENTP